MKYPKSVLAKSQKGKLEARVFKSKGKFVEYKYRDPETNEKVKGGKRKLCLKNEEGEVEQFMIIPLKGAKSLFIKPKDQQIKDKKVWDPEEERVINLEKIFK